MAMIKIDEPRMPVNPRSLALLALGFRPFFLAASIAAIALQLIWMGALAGWWATPQHYGYIGWHSHEMLFGYTSAVIAGFLLTAVRNWTDIDTPTGTGLAMLTLLWLLGRLAPFLSPLIPPTMIAVIDLSFMPVLAIVLSIPLIRTKQSQNLIFLIILGLLTLANVLVHLQALQLHHSSARLGTYLGALLIIILIEIMGGRVIPFFTERAIEGFQARRWPLIEWGGHLSVVIFAISVVAEFQDMIMISGISTFVFQGIRLGGWLHPLAWRNPILWVLHAGYCWLVLGFLLFALQGHLGLTPWAGLHALTTGAIGVITLGMMSRVTLGHTGRMMQAPAVMTWAFLLLNMAALLRVFGPWLQPDLSTQWLILSSLLWIFAFSLFVLVFTPILIRARIDGRPG
jgi:uncharacterized protein involved in response to NO